MSKSLQKNLSDLDQKTEHSLHTGRIDWFMKGSPKIQTVSEGRIRKALAPGVLLRPTRDLTDAEAREVVERSYKRFGDDSLFAPLRVLFNNPVAPITSDEERASLHPIVFTLLLMAILFLVLAVIVARM